MISREHKARFVVVVEAKDGQSGVHGLRWLLKRLRDRDLRCIDAYELAAEKRYAPVPCLTITITPLPAVPAKMRNI